jgi:hypothetical protein
MAKMRLIIFNPDDSRSALKKDETTEYSVGTQYS